MESKLEIVMRQTNYDKETAEKKLIEHNYDLMLVVREYMGPPKKKDTPTLVVSANQQRYKEIRGMMDEAARAYQYGLKK